MRIVILGTGPFAVPTCSSLLQAGHDLPLVVTRPPADPSAKKQPPRPVHAWAVAAGLEIFEPSSINEPAAIARLAQLNADLLFVCDYGQILSNEALATSRLGGINLHGSLLPRHRGAAPVQWTLLSGDSQAGVTVIHMTPRLDAGPALSIRSTDIRPDETAEELEPRLAELGVSATEEAIRLLADWDGIEVLGQVQDKTLITKAPRFTKSDGRLDFSLPAEHLARLVRACQPWPGTFAELVLPDGKRMRLIVRRARALPSIAQLRDARPGTTIALNAAAEGLDQPSLGNELVTKDELVAKDWTRPWRKLLCVATGEGTLAIARVQPAGKREMDSEEFLRGHSLDQPAHFE